MERINSLVDLLIEELAYLLNAENQLVAALPILGQAGQSPALRSLFKDHWITTKEQARRLYEIFSSLDRRPPPDECRVIRELITAGRETVNDSALIAAAQRIEKYEIEGYGTAREHAGNLGHTHIVELLEKSLNEERNMNLQLSEVAQGLINMQAIDPKSSGFYPVHSKFAHPAKKKIRRPSVPRFFNDSNPDAPEEQKGD